MEDAEMPDQEGHAEQPPIWLRSEEEILSLFRRVEAGRPLNPLAWPNGARVAVAFSLDVDNQSPAVVEGEGVGSISLGQYGERRGIQRLTRMFDKHDIPATYFMPAMSLKDSPHMVDVISKAGHHEVAVHGWVHELPTDLTEDQHRELLTRSTDYLEHVFGVRPVGYRAPVGIIAEHTYPLLKELGFLYDSSLLSDDVPFEINIDGKPSGLIELPASLGLEDTQLTTQYTGFSNGFPPSEVLKIFKDEFDVAYDEGTMVLLILHPHVSGQRSRAVVIDAFISYMRSKPDVWFTTHRQLAECASKQLM